MNVCEDEKLTIMMNKLTIMMKKMTIMKMITIMMIQFIPDVDCVDILSVNGKGALSFDNRTANSASACLRSEMFPFEHQVIFFNYHGHRQYNCSCFQTLTQVEVLDWHHELLQKDYHLRLSA